MDFSLFKDLLFNKVLLSSVIAQLSSQIFKVFLPLFYGKRPDVKQFTKYGNMPSAHTAFITSACLSVGLVEGFKSSIFGFSFVVSAIIIYDIIFLRRAVEFSLNKVKKDNEIVPQFKSHSNNEIIAGGIWGIICAIVINLIIK